MATRRRYKSRGYKDGGAVPPSNITDAQQPETIATAPPVEPIKKLKDYPDLPPSNDLDAVRRGAEAVRRADEIQAELRRDPRAIIDAHIDGMDLSAHKKAFLKANPLILSEHVMPIMSRAYHQALADGIADDSEQMNQHILQAVRHGIETQRQMPAMAPPPTMPQMPAIPSYDRDEVERLDAEAADYLARMKAPMPAPPLPPIATPRRSLPVSAPVSRDVPTAGGQKTSAQQTVTLTPEQREIAWGAYHWLSKPAAEAEYARQRLKLSALRKAGLYPESDRN